MVIVYLLRHGIAADRAAGGFARDADRPLTDEGWDKLRQEAAGMRALKLKLDLIFTSPLRRARETAQVVAEAFRLQDKTVIVEALAPGRGLRDVVDERAPVFVELGQQFRRAMLVGHQPDLGELASALLSGDLDLQVEFKKGAVCALEIEGPAPHSTNKLLWLLAPRQLRMLGTKVDTSGHT